MVPSMRRTGSFRRCSDGRRGIVDAPRAVLAWEEPEEPWLYLATWQRGKCRLVKEPPGYLDTLVTEELGGDDFLCSRRGASVLRATAHGLGTWQGDPLHPAFRASFDVTSVVGVTLKAETAKGWLFFLDKPRMTSDDLLMGRVVSRHIARRLNQLYVTRRLQEAAALEERLRLARDLHDGVFHIFTGMALSVDTLTRVPAAERERSQEGLRSIQANLQEGQRTLRHLIGALKNPVCPTRGRTATWTRVWSMSFDGWRARGACASSRASPGWIGCRRSARTTCT